MKYRRHRVACVLSDGMSSIGLAIANDVFGQPWEQVFGVPWYRYQLCTADPSPLRVGPLRAEVTHGIDALSRVDTVIIPGRGAQSPAPELLAALRCASERGTRMVSFCTGAYLLAEAGLLDGRPATTLWTHADRFRERFPAVRLNPGVLYIDDGQVLTSAGNSAAADLALHIVRRDYGAEIASRVAQQMVAPMHRRGDQAQYLDAPLGNRAGVKDQIGATLEWALQRLNQPLPVKALAARSTLSPRHFTRQFRKTTGTTPHRWLLTQRLTLAQRLLETTSLPVDQVASSAGFGTPAAMRLQFQQALNTSPATYRQTFRTTSAD